MLYKNGRYKITDIKDGGKSKKIFYGNIKFDAEHNYTINYDGGGYAKGIDPVKHFAFIRINRNAWRVGYRNWDNEYMLDWIEYELMEEE